MRGPSILKQSPITLSPQREPTNKIEMANKKFVSQIALANESQEDFMKTGPYESSSSQLNNALQSTGAFKVTRFSFDVPKAEESAAAEAESTTQHNFNSQIGA